MRFDLKKCLVAAAALAGVSLSACATDGGAGRTAASGGETTVAMRRITGPQYRHAIDDIFGPGLTIQGRFEPEQRREGLLAIGASSASVSPVGLDQYYGMGASIADQALSKDRRDKTMPCAPASPTAADDACVRQTVTKYGRLLFRRALTEREIASRVALANQVATSTNDFYAGAKEALTSLLASPDFFFRVEKAVTVGRERQLDGYSRASRLSYLFWDTTPDAELLQAAENGALMTPDGLAAQVERLSASPRAKDGMRAFFDDMLQLSLFDNLSKDPSQFPKFNQLVAEAAREQTLRTTIDILVDKNSDYRDIFTSRDTFMNRPLAIVYKVPYGSKDAWRPYTFSEASGRAGILTQISFLSLFSHPARSSPTKRGVALNEIFLCEVTPAPPNNVDFSIVNETSSTTLKTTRARLLAHATDETCAGCHNLVDPPGLALEHFDSLGQLRTTENGELIDVTSEIDGVKFDGAQGLATVLHDNPRVPECLVRNLYAAMRGAAVEVDEETKIQALTKDFVAGGYRVPAFVKRLALSDALYAAPARKPVEGEQHAAAPHSPFRMASNQARIIFPGE